MVLALFLPAESVRHNDIETLAHGILQRACPIHKRINQLFVTARKNLRVVRPQRAKQFPGGLEGLAFQGAYLNFTIMSIIA